MPIDWITCWTRVAHDTLMSHHQKVLNQLEWTEVAMHLYQSFSLTCVQISVCIWVLIYENKAISDKGLVSFIYILLMFHVSFAHYLGFIAEMNKRNIELAMASVSAIIFIVYVCVFSLYQENDVVFKLQHLYRNWIQIDCILILIQLPYLKLYNKRVLNLQVECVL